MAREPRGTPFSGSAFIRSLAALNDVPTLASKDGFAERLSGWMAWTDAIALSSALNAPSVTPPSPRAASAAADEREYLRVRSALLKSIDQAMADAALPELALNWTRPSDPVETRSAADTRGDFGPHRLRYATRQQAMEAGIAPLRRRLRASLAAGSPELEKLAALDAVMEQVVAPQERALLATVTRSLETHFQRLRQASAEADTTPSPDWLSQFCQDMHGLLKAELALRLLPVEALLEALCHASPGLSTPS